MQLWGQFLGLYLLYFFKIFNKAMKKFLILALLTGLTACKKEAPKCSDEKVTDLAINLFHSEVMKAVEEQMLPRGYRSFYTQEEIEKGLEEIRQDIYAKAPGLDRKQTNYKIENIRTVDFNKETGAYRCKGSMVTYSKANGSQIGSAEVLYTSEISDDGKSFYVSIKLQQ